MTLRARIRLTMGVLWVGGLLAAGTAHADVNKCQQALDKAGSKLEATIAKTLAKCVKTAQAEVDAGLDVSLDTAQACDTAIKKIATARGKALGKCVGLGASGKCSSADLYLAGHLVSEAGGSAAVGQLNGPGVGDIGLTPGPADFACQWLIDSAYQNGIKGLFARVPNAQTRIVEAAQADTGLAYPDLQTFAGQEPGCATHICNLEAANSGVMLFSSTLGVLPLTLTGSLPIDLCRPVASADTRSVQAGTVLLMGRAAKGFPPINLFGMATACIRTLKIEGECNCGQAAPANGNLSVCRDSDTNIGTDCAAGPGTKTLAPVGGTDNGPLYADFIAPALGTGGCHGTLTIELGLHEGPALATSCTSQGPTTAKLPPTTILFTTASVSETVLDTAAGTLGPVYGGVQGTNGSPGVAIACSAAEAGVLTGLQLVGAASTLDNNTMINDGLLGLGLTCQ